LLETIITTARGIHVKRIQALLSVLLFFLLLGSPSQSVAVQKNGLAPVGHRLEEAWAELQKEPNDYTTQKRYLAAFPQSYKSFLALFGLNGELYGSAHEYVDVLPTLARNHERAVGSLLLHLSEDAHYEADAPSYLQHATATYGSEHTRTFAKLLGSLPVGKQSRLIAFLADVENPAAYPEYQAIIDHLKALGDGGLAAKFEVARENRSGLRHGEA
jgi:hypothetical protein